MTAEVRHLSWVEVKALIRMHIPATGAAYGVPRGGAIVAGLTGRAVESPGEADFIVDDIVDSGRTRAAWKKSWPRKPFFALVDKTNPKAKLDGWVHFPWETEPARDAADSVVRLLEFIGEDPTREGLLDTPNRVVKAWSELTTGYKQDPAAILARDFHGDGYDQMVVCRNVEFVSMCEHHMLPFNGVAHVGYLPKGRVVGLSKMARLVDCYARRLQVQERLTGQVAAAMQQHLKPHGVGVMVVARHACMSCRGVMKHKSDMVTTALTGVFKRQDVKAEFLGYCGGQSA